MTTEEKNLSKLHSNLYYFFLTQDLVKKQQKKNNNKKLSFLTVFSVV